MMGYCNASGIGVIPWSPLATSKLARPLSAHTDRGETIKKRGLHEGEAEDEIVRREEVAKKKGWPMAQVAIAWSLSKVISPIIGINSVSTHPASYIRHYSCDAHQVERLEQAILGDKSLSQEEIAYLEEPCVECHYNETSIP